MNRLHTGPANIHTENNFTHFTPKVKAVTSPVLRFQVTVSRKLVEQIQHLTGEACSLEPGHPVFTPERAAFRNKAMCDLQQLARHLTWGETFRCGGKLELFSAMANILGAPHSGPH